MLLQRYLNIINEINPDKIYVENVRSFFKVPRTVAKLMCEMAVVDKLFEKKIGIECPNSDCRRIIAAYNSYSQIPITISCDICENEGKDIFTFNTADLNKVEFYKLKNRIVEDY